MGKCFFPDFAARPCQDLEREAHRFGDAPTPRGPANREFLPLGLVAFGDTRSDQGVVGGHGGLLTKTPCRHPQQRGGGGKVTHIHDTEWAPHCPKEVTRPRENPHTPPSPPPPSPSPFPLLQAPARPIADASATRCALAHPTRGALWPPWLLSPPVANGKEAGEERRPGRQGGEGGAGFMSWLSSRGRKRLWGLVPGDGVHEREARYGSFCSAIAILVWRAACQLVVWGLLLDGGGA